MALFAFQWPNALLLTSLTVLLVSVFVPWIRYIRSGPLPVILFPSAFATILWLAYETRLHQLAPSGDPLIRVDLLLILPLVLVTWISTAAAAASRRDSSNK